MSGRPMILCENLVRNYKVADLEVVALQGLDLAVERGEIMAIIGNSGSGKSTLLNIIGGLDRPSAGGRRGRPRPAEDGRRRHGRLPARTVGFVWQSNARNLVPWLTARENVELPMLVGHHGGRTARAKELLEMVGLGHRAREPADAALGRRAAARGHRHRARELAKSAPCRRADRRGRHGRRDAPARRLPRGARRLRGHGDRRHARSAPSRAGVDRVVAIRDGRTSSELVRSASYREEVDGMWPRYGRGRARGDGDRGPCGQAADPARIPRPARYRGPGEGRPRGRADRVITPPKKEA